MKSERVRGLVLLVAGSFAGIFWLIWMVGNTSLAQTASPVSIDQVLFDGYALNDMDEAVRLINTSDRPVSLAGWSLSDGGSALATITAEIKLSPGEGTWLARDLVAFRTSFGEDAGYQPARWPGFANEGDEVFLLDEQGRLMDTLVYMNGNTLQAGWSGSATWPYKVTGVFGVEGQILYRRRDPGSGRPVIDTDTASDWAQMTADVVNGRKVLYPGWDIDRYFFPGAISSSSTLTVAVAPDNAYETLLSTINHARTSIDLASLTLENVGLGTALAAAAQRGVGVSVLLEGAPPGGIADQERYICSRLEAAGGSCWFMISDSTWRIHDRYSYMHAKYLVIDGRIAVVSSENFSPNSMPSDPKSDGTWGRRGVVLITDNGAIADHLSDLFDDDLDPDHTDILRWSAEHPVYGAPPPGFTPLTTSGGITYTVRYPEAAVFPDVGSWELGQAPENALRSDDGLLGIVNRVGQGDSLFVQQLAERPYWGATNSDSSADPNPRLEAYIAAARRGASVRLLLDQYLDHPDSKVSNAVSCAYVNTIAGQEALSLRCSLGNPTGLGIHNKMVLARIDGHGYIHVGSLNGTELSHKGNREVTLQIQSDEAFHYLAGMFAADLGSTVYLPVNMREFAGAANRLLISEIVYDTPGPDQAEFIELVNPTGVPVLLDGYAVGDAVQPADFEDRHLFPPGIVIPPGKTLVVALSAVAFWAEFGKSPDFEIIDSDPDVADLLDDPAWGDPKALFQLGNNGDEVLLWSGGSLVDVVAYGDGSHPAVVSCPLLVQPNRSLERIPYWRDTDDCLTDFRAWPFPSPGRLP